MKHSFNTASKRTPRRGRRIGLIVLIALVWIAISRSKPISLTKTVTVKQGDTLNVFFTTLSGREKWKLKSYIKTHDVDLAKLQLGSYQFSGSYSPKEFFEIVTAGPTSQYVRFTVLEGRSIYDIDASLADKGFADAGAYIAAVSSPELIKKFGATYDYIASAYAEHNFPTLEGWLYPDTYFIDPSKDTLDQLITLQLKAFHEKVAEPYVSAITAFPSLLQAKGITISYSMDLRNILRLASVIEKEERNTQNKPTVAGVFFNRLKEGTLLGADITLCYGIRKAYEQCTPSIIGANITDADNIYNTRVHRGLPPTPIANPSLESIRSVLEFVKTEYFFYLHDDNGIIRYAKDIQGHNENVSKYLK